MKIGMRFGFWVRFFAPSGFGRRAREWRTASTTSSTIGTWWGCPITCTAAALRPITKCTWREERRCACGWEARSRRSAAPRASAPGTGGCPSSRLRPRMDRCATRSPTGLRRCRMPGIGKRHSVGPPRERTTSIGSPSGRPTPPPRRPKRKLKSRPTRRRTRIRSRQSSIPGSIPACMPGRGSWPRGNRPRAWLGTRSFPL